MALYDEFTGQDSFRLYFTGASTDGGAQSDPQLSLGKNRSSTEIVPVIPDYSSSISNLTVDYISGAIAASGDLGVVSDDVVEFKADGGGYGVDVTILNGETKFVPVSIASDKFIRITRTSATALTGNITFTVTRPTEDIISGDNVTGGEASAGDDEYWALMIKNVSASSITSLSPRLIHFDFDTVDSGGYASSGAITITATNPGAFANSPASGHVKNRTTDEVMYYSSRDDDALTVPALGRDVYSDVGGGAAGTSTDDIYTIPMMRLGIEAPASQPSGAITDNTGAGIKTAPGGVTFYTELPGDNNIDIPTLVTTNISGLWVHRKIVAGMSPVAEILNSIRFFYDAFDG